MGDGEKNAVAAPSNVIAGIAGTPQTGAITSGSGAAMSPGLGNFWALLMPSPQVRMASQRAASAITICAEPEHPRH